MRGQGPPTKKTSNNGGHPVTGTVNWNDKHRVRPVVGARDLRRSHIYIVPEEPGLGPTPDVDGSRGRTRLTFGRSSPSGTLINIQ